MSVCKILICKVNSDYSCKIHVVEKKVQYFLLKYSTSTTKSQKVPQNCTYITGNLLRKLCSWQQWTGLCFCFMALSCWDVDAQWSLCLLGSAVASVRASDWSGGKKWKKATDFVFELFCFLLRDVSVPQSGDWWILGPLEGGHEEGPEHCGCRWHDSHLTGCFPRTYWCSSAHMQQRVSMIHSSVYSWNTL